jgi:hypothetical protein
MERNQRVESLLHLPAAVARKMGLTNHPQFDDLVAAGSQALVEAADTWDPAKSPNGEDGWGPFAGQRIRWRILAELGREKRHVAASIDVAIDGEDDDGATLAQALQDRRFSDPAEAAGAKDQVRKRGYRSLKLADARALTPRPEGVGAWAEKLREAAFNAVSENDVTDLMKSLVERAKADEGRKED